MSAKHYNPSTKEKKIMKKAIALILALALCLSLCSCGKSEEVKAVDALIAEAKQQSDPDVTTLLNLWALYHELSEEDKEKLDDLNYAKAAEGILTAKVLFDEKDFSGAANAIYLTQTYADSAQTKVMNDLLNTIYYPDTQFVRFENLLNYEGNVTLPLTRGKDVVAVWYKNPDKPYDPARVNVSYSEKKDGNTMVYTYEYDILDSGSYSLRDLESFDGVLRHIEDYYPEHYFTVTTDQGYIRYKDALGNRIACSGTFLGGSVLDSHFTIYYAN